MLRVTTVASILIATLSLLGGCGSGGGDDAVTLGLGSAAALDGWVESDGTVVTGAGGPLVGDFDAVQPNVGYRQFFSFSLAGIPAGATVTNATLQLHQQITFGTPFATHGVVVVDHVDYGATLDAADYLGGTITAGIGTIASDATAGIRTLDVTARVAADIAAARTRSQYRLRFSVLDTDNDGASDYTQFCDAENSISGTGTLPVLLVTYE
jgi:hypothetical protein